jgi:hypothetical protein
VHGVNQKGRFGGMQLILATDPEGVIVDFYYQRLSSPEAARFTDRSFTTQFMGLSLVDFDRHRPGASDGREEGRWVEDPSEESKTDFEATLRGLRKNLILLDEFTLGNSYSRQIEESEQGEATTASDGSEGADVAQDRARP